jgi:hypothetical protein
VKLQARIPRLVTSTVQAGPETAEPVLDGRDIVVDNVWRLPPFTVALVGRPAVWVSLDLTSPKIALGPLRIPPLRARFEQDFGGHLYLIVTGEDATEVRMVEAGPLHAGGFGNLVPYCYPENEFARRGAVDFDPVAIPPPLGMTPEFFTDLVVRTQRTYDGDQRYRVIEVPFLRVGRDSNSYAVGVLLAAGLDPRAIRKPNPTRHHEWAGYPGAADPVHRANFGAYLGAPQDLGGGVMAAPYYDADGSLRYVAIGGNPCGTARLPSGSVVMLDALGRLALSPQDALRHHLAPQPAPPPKQILERRMFPPDPQTFGAQITVVVDGVPAALQPGESYRGKIAARNDALGLALLNCDGKNVVLPLLELGVELRDPKRVDRLLHVGNELTVGLLPDRRAKLVAHGPAAVYDSLHVRRSLRDFARGAYAGAAGGVASALVETACEALFPQSEARAELRRAAAALVAKRASFGMLAGAAYGAAADTAPYVKAGCGGAFALACWLTVLPALSAAGRRPAGALGFVLWGLGLETVRGALRPRL